MGDLSKDELESKRSSLKKQKKKLNERKKKIDKVRDNLNDTAKDVKKVNTALDNFINDLETAVIGSSGINKSLRIVSDQMSTVYGFKDYTDAEALGDESRRLAIEITSLESQISTTEYQLKCVEEE